ncbi:MAG: DNA primase [Defluviitaleaceae bacterium]|nr:DNA primase [Defluviitaleaceae bacterium]
MNYDFVKEEILQGTDIVDLIGSYISLKKRGDSYLGNCPFHNEKTPSFTVNSVKGVYKCFGCGEGGDAYSFIMKYENIGFKEAMEKLAERINYTIPKSKKINKHEKLYEINTVAAKFFYSNLLSNESSKKYLYDRLNEKTAKKFGIGYSRDSWDALYKHLIDKGYKQEDIVNLGLAINKNGKIYDRFRDRIMFPIFNPSGKIIGFGGRTITEDITPKYLNSPDSPLYNKSLSLYGINFVKGSESVILVEGYMDVLALHSFGFINAIAALGTAFTNDHANLLTQKKFKKAIIIFDADDAGKKATMRAAQPLLKNDIEISILTLKTAKDPDEFLKKFGKEAFEKALLTSKNYMEYCIEILLEKYNIDVVSEKRDFLNELATKLKIVKDKIELEVYASFISEKFEISKEIFLNKINEMAPVNLPRKMRQKTDEPKALIEAKENLLSLAFHNEEFCEILRKHLNLEEFPELYEEQAYLRETHDFNKIAVNDYIKIIKENYINIKLQEASISLEEVNNLLFLKKTLKNQYIGDIFG